MRASLGAFLSLSLAGCFVSSGQGELMRNDIDSLKGRVETMEQRDQEINQKVAQLRSILDEATALLGRNSADLGAKVARNETDNAMMAGRLEEAKHLLAELQKQVTEIQGKLSSIEVTSQQVAETQQKLVNKVAPSIPDNKDDVWKEAQARLASGDRDEARRFLRSFVQRFPSDPRAATAQLQIGISYIQELKHTNAVGEFSNLIQRFPRAPEVAEAMYQMAESFIALKFCGDAKATLQDMVKRYPRHPRVAKAKARLRDLRKISRNKNLCTS